MVSVEAAGDEREAARPKSPSTLAAVFLDVDGVIDSRKVPCIEATKVERLRRAVAAVPDCVVVISSHWRLVPKALAPKGVDVPDGVKLQYEIELLEVLPGYF